MDPRNKQLIESVFAGSGEMATRMRAFDWSKTPLGPVEQWPQSLRIAVRIILGSGYPMHVSWGPDYTFLYNDAWRPNQGARHPAFGLSCREVWSEIWDDIGPLYEKVMTRGQHAASLSDKRFLLTRNNYIEETYFVFSFSPIADDTGYVGGLLGISLETTERVIEHRRRRVLCDLASRIAEARNEEEVWRISAETIGQNPSSIPFAFLYEYRPGERIACLAAASLEAGDALHPEVTDCDREGIWQFHNAQAVDCLVVEIDQWSSALRIPDWPTPPREACVVPIGLGERSEALGFLVAGIHPGQAFDDAYRQFVHRITEQITIGLASARSYDQERERLRASEERLEEASRRYREQERAATELQIQVDLLQQLPVSAWTLKPDGTPEFVNQVWLGFAGQTLEFVRSHPEAWMTAVHPEDREMAARRFWEGVNSGQGFAFETRSLRAQDETYRWHLQQAVVLRDAEGKALRFVGTTTDIDDQKRAEEKIRQSENAARQLIDLSPTHITELGRDGERLYCNRATLNYYGISLEEWKEAAFQRLLHPQDAEMVRKDLPVKLRGGSPFEYEVRLKRNDGQYRWFQYRVGPAVDPEGHTTRWYAAGTDIDERKLAEQRLQEENVALREEIDKSSMFEEIVGTSAPLKSVLSRISKVAPTDSSVLITGETGTGKELVARAIHRHSRRSAHPFVSVNCAVIPRDLIASELFGHEKGAFTGATHRRLGRFELAEKGTIFLDEVGELPAETQIALLRVLQEREFERVGGTGAIRADIRVIAATNRDLESAIAAGKFRSDLFYRLNVFPIEMPPLRKRREDVPLLVAYFLNRYARKAGRSFTAVDKNSLERMQAYAWPGNIRELQNVIERSVIVNETETFSVDESWLSRQPPSAERALQPGAFKRSAAEEKAIVEAALRECGGRVYGPSGAAARLGMPRSTLESKIRALKINKNSFKE